MSIYSKVHIKNSIATYLLTVVFSIYFVVTLTVTLTHMTLEYINTKQGVLDDLKLLHKSFAKGINGNVWNLDQEQLQNIIEGMILHRNIIGIKVVNDENELLAMTGLVSNQEEEYATIELEKASLQDESLVSGFSGVIEMSFPVLYEKELLGAVTLYTNSEVVFQKVKLGFFLIIINSIIKTIALWVIFLWTSRFILSHPLSILTAATEKINEDNLEEIKINVKTNGRNELKILEETFNSMIQKLILSKKRGISLRKFSNEIGKFTHPIQSLLFMFQEIRVHTENMNAIFCYDLQEGKFTQHTFSKQGSGFLKELLTFIWNEKLLPQENSLIQSKEVNFFNALEAGTPLHTFYSDMANLDLEGSHLLCITIKTLEPHVFCLFREKGSPHFDSADLNYIQSMVSEVKIVQKNLETIKENARMEGELKTAAAVQNHLFPKSLPQLKNLELASFFQSASETGGDWFGFMTRFKGNLLIQIGDVTGHGTPAAIVTATASATCKTMEDLFFNYVSDQVPPSPATCLKHLNSAIFKAGAPDYLMTFFIIQIDLDTGKITFSGAGHNYPILLHANGSLEYTLNTNARLGFQNDLEFTENSLQLQNGDTLILYTDGLIENQNPEGKLWGERQLIHHLKENTHLSAQELVDSIMRKANDFYDSSPIGDDIALVACQVTQPFQKTLNSD